MRNPIPDNERLIPLRANAKRLPHRTTASGARQDSTNREFATTRAIIVLARSGIRFPSWLRLQFVSAARIFAFPVRSVWTETGMALQRGDVSQVAPRTHALS